MSQTRAIIMAAGQGTRMKTEVPKVLHELCGRPLLAYVIDACRAAGVGRMCVVIGYGAEQVRERFAAATDVDWVLQDRQKGTADAVTRCREHLAGFEGLTLVLCGDAPLVRPETIRALVEAKNRSAAAAALGTAMLEDPTGYGRIVRGPDRAIQAIVEQFDCNEQQALIKEINPSFYIFDNKALFEALAQVRPDNAREEYYLTDVVELLIKEGRPVEAVTAVEPEEAIGINSRAQLAAAGAIMQRRIQVALMDGGVTIVDPEKTWIGSDARIGRDTVIEPFTYVGPSARIGCRCRVGPMAVIEGGAVIEDGVVVGPAVLGTA